MIDIDFAIKTVENAVKNFQVPVVDLMQAQTNEPWKVLVATLLSARTKDDVTANAVKKLFAKIKTIFELTEMSEDEIAKIIFPVGFYNQKAKYLKKLPTALQTKFHGIIPHTVEELIELPGVGRKTANLVVAVAFAKPAICVDTHVHRIMNIWGYVKTKNPLETEMALWQKLDKKYWLIVNRVLVTLGQSICRPISPHCSNCPIKEECPRIGVTPRKNSKFENLGKNMKNKGLKLMSWNVNGLRAVAKKDFDKIILAENPDVIGLQETKCEENQLDESIKKIGDYQSYFFSAKRRGYSSVAIYTKVKPISIIYGIDNGGIFDFEGRVITAEFENFYFVNCYFPNSQDKLARLDYKRQFNAAILNFCNQLKQKKAIVICGDFNVAHQPIDLKNPKQNEQNAGYSWQEREDMDKFLLEYIDTFRMFNQHADQFSWWSFRFSAREKNIGWRIDYFCVDIANRGRVLDAQINQDILGSDHCPITLYFSEK